MFLAIDVSNTETVLGIYESSTLRHHWRLQTDIGRTADEYGVLVNSLLSEAANPKIDGIAVASSVPPMTRTLEELCREYLGVAPMFVGPGVRTGMPILYDKPQEVGADRIANAIAAYDRTRATTIVVDFSTATIESTSRAGYFPGATPITVKVVVERSSGRLLGAQIVGKEGAAKRIDVLATAIWNEMTVDEIQQLDLAYAPPFSPVWDPALVAARRAGAR